MRFRGFAAVALLALSGCATSSDTFDIVPRPSGDQGRSTAARTILAAMGTGLVGRSGFSLDDADRRLALQAEYRALEYTPPGEVVRWRGKDVSGEVAAAQPYRVGSQDCRQYSHSVAQDPRRQTVRGTACRNADGSWTPLT